MSPFHVAPGAERSAVLGALTELDDEVVRAEPFLLWDDDAVIDRVLSLGGVEERTTAA